VGTQGPEDENGQGDVRSHPPDTGDDVEEQEALSQARPKSEGFRYGWHGSFLSGVPVRPGFPYGTILTASRVKGLTESSRKPHETLNSLVDRRGLWLRRGDVLTGGLGQQPLLGSDDRAVVPLRVTSPRLAGDPLVRLELPGIDVPVRIDGRIRGQHQGGAIEHRDSVLACCQAGGRLAKGAGVVPPRERDRRPLG